MLFFKEIRVVHDLAVRDQSARDGDIVLEQPEDGERARLVLAKGRLLRSK